MQLQHGLLLASILIFFVSLAALPAVLIYMPADYFARDARQASPLRFHPIVRGCFLMVKNVAGVVLFAAGVVMLFTPGQGILGMLAGLWLMDFPQKQTLERRIVARPGVMRALNALRARFGRPAFEPPRP